MEEDGMHRFRFLICFCSRVVRDRKERKIVANSSIAANAFEELFRDEPLSITDGPAEVVE